MNTGSHPEEQHQARSAPKRWTHGRAQALTLGTGFLLLFGLAACGGDASRQAPVAASDSSAVSPDVAAADAAVVQPDPFPVFARRATAIELGLDEYHEVAGTWEAGATSARFAAHFDGDTLQFAEAIMNRGEYGDATAVYYFADGLPFYVVQEEQRTRLDPRESGQHDTIQTRAAFAPDGSIAAKEQVVNGTVRDAPLVEVRGLWNHARALAAEAQQTGRPAL